MSYSIETTKPFRKQVKKLIKKYPSLKSELKLLGEKLLVNPIQGKSLGNECYKIRLSIKSKGVGKSGGGRIITHVVHFNNKCVYLLNIYDKSDKETISDKELSELLSSIK